MRRGNLAKAPNYTNAALAMGLVNLLWIFMVIWVMFGLSAVLASGYAIHCLINRLAHKRA